jgi:hypothetical protein
MGRREEEKGGQPKRKKMVFQFIHVESLEEF